MKIAFWTPLLLNLPKKYKRGNVFVHNHVLTTMQKTFSSWHIIGAVCLERKPILTQLLTPLEQRYFQYLLKFEVEKSYLSEHEKRHIEDLKANEKLKKGTLEDLDSVAKQTAQDFEDASIEDFNKYIPRSRKTEADEKNDRQSVERHLDSSLVYVQKYKLGNDERWLLPQAIRQEGETLRQTVERALKESFSHLPRVQFMGNAPVGYYKYKYPKLVRGNGVCGAKVFFFKAQLREKCLQTADAKLKENESEHLWLTHSELPELLQTDYAKAVQSFLLPDTFDIDLQNLTSSSSSSEEDEPAIKTSALN